MDGLIFTTPSFLSKYDCFKKFRGAAMGIVSTKYSMLFSTEFRKMKKGLLTLMTFHCVYILVLYLTIDMIPKRNNGNPLWLLYALSIWFSYYLYPALLLYSLYSDSQREVKIDSVLYARWVPVLIKFLITISAILLMFAIPFLYYFMFIYQPDPVTVLTRYFRKPNSIISSYIRHFGGPFIVSCLACTIWGAIQAIEKYRHLWAIGIGISGLGLYRTIMAHKRVYHWELLPSSILQYLDNWNLDHLAVTLLIGAVYLILGLKLYNRYADV